MVVAILDRQIYGSAKYKHTVVSRKSDSHVCDSSTRMLTVGLRKVNSKAGLSISHFSTRGRLFLLYEAKLGLYCSMWMEYLIERLEKLNYLI